jgi:vitamin B12 transporter
MIRDDIKRNRRRLGAATLALAIFAGEPDRALAESGARGGTLPTLDETIVTASRRAEPNRQIAASVQVITEQEILKSPAKTVTDLLAENAVGFLSEWTPGQTSLNIRGGASDGQGKDFASQVLVLINGRRAGTANLSKLSLTDVKRIEIVRGPASVSYGSQAMGGVVNIILRDGRNTQGSMVQMKTGSWGLAQGNAYHAGDQDGLRYYLGAGGGHRDDYETGRRCIECDLSNTSWTRAGGVVTFGYDPAPEHRFDLIARSDGHYKVGFRGSSADLDNNEDRYNQSFDAVYNGATADKRLKWTNQAYVVHDVDDLRWGSENGGVNIDFNERRLDIWGLRNALDLAVTPSNDLLAGLDLEYSTIRSFRHRTTNAGVTSIVAPFDNNQRERVAGVFVEDVQRFFDDRLAVRGGVRFTYGETTILRTPGNAALKESNDNYDQLTYSAGATYLLTDAVKLRAGYATGFRAPTGTELAADFTTVLGTQIIGNSNLKSESSEQVEIGVSTFHPLVSTDLALFQNLIKDRITTTTIGPGNRKQFTNNPGDIVIQGLEGQINLDLGRLFNHANAWRLFARANYNFSLQDHGTRKNVDKAERVYYYQGAIGTTYGQAGRWEVGLLGILRGPMWWDTEETFVGGFEPNSEFVHRKGSFWVFNLHGLYHVPDNTRLFGVRLPKGLTLFGHVNNIFDRNQHPIFFALDREPRVLGTSNGGVGNSLPGREFVVGARLTF